MAGKGGWLYIYIRNAYLSRVLTSLCTYAWEILKGTRQLHEKSLIYLKYVVGISSVRSSSR